MVHTKWITSEASSQLRIDTDDQVANRDARAEVAFESAAHIAGE
jgi:hypothetical protein